ncbi:RIP metalloprotease RseP [Candidatus Endolissoclinum faulkneri L2]|uniref:Zinc metalloprotease n=1 Tax=Candidatus Endolissoclinum faulkneri L2 TaxID=1193729 RepID=K7Z4R6_9PROT|nr:RIP metalloprotease RseP [Candidatus Endolissoclinum faulkneri]AFX99003.1 RIP metalloprotease RseP [Candidatus Endolissoclinum faulkneri L2]
MIDIITDYILPFLVIMSLLVFVHELGHYFVARRNGVRVEVFSIGFGLELFGWSAKNGTRWKICAIPLGGYVKMFGDDKSIDGISYTEEDRREAFYYKSPNARAGIVIAGPVANLIFAILVLSFLYMWVGQSFAPAVVANVIKNSPADRAGIMSGDTILSVNGKKIINFSDLRRIIIEQPGKLVMLVIKRNGATYNVPVTTEIVVDLDSSGNKKSLGRIGIQSNHMLFDKLNPLKAVMLAITTTFSIIVQTFEAIGEMLIGMRSTDELGGPLRIAELSGTVTHNGLITTMWFTAVLSINLGLINMLPIPILDGSHLIFYALESIRGRPLSPQVYEWASVIGMSIIVILMLFVTWKDLIRLNVSSYLSSLIK